MVGRSVIPVTSFPRYGMSLQIDQASSFKTFNLEYTTLLEHNKSLQYPESPGRDSLSHAQRTHANVISVVVSALKINTTRSASSKQFRPASTERYKFVDKCFRISFQDADAYAVNNQDVFTLH